MLRHRGVLEAERVAHARAGLGHRAQGTGHRAQGTEQMAQGTWHRGIAHEKEQAAVGWHEAQGTQGIDERTGFRYAVHAGQGQM